MRQISVIMTSGFAKNVLKQVRRQWRVIDIPDQRQALEYLTSVSQIPDIAVVGNVGNKADIDATTMLREIHKLNPNVPVIISTKTSSPAFVVELVKLGAFDYVLEPTKPDDPSQVAQQIQDLLFALTRAAQWTKMLRENQKLRENLIRKNMPDMIQGRSEKMQRVLDLIQKVAPTTATVLLTGESGTGKELAARTIHSLSNNKSGPFLALNCGALSENLLTSELFGHVKGAFTGADSNRTGLIRQAAGGTLFLDEISTVSANFQVMLLRVLEQRRATPVGQNRDFHIDCRFIAAANRDLEQMVREGKFREDLFYRLNVFHIHIPPLRQRKEDIPVLADFFLSQAVRDYGKNIQNIAPTAMELLETYSWPGNIRQLRNAVERAVITSEGPQITESDLDAPIRNHREASAIIDDDVTYDQAMQQFERRLLRSALLRSGQNRSQAARILNINRTTLNYRLRKLKLT